MRLRHLGIVLASVVLGAAVVWAQNAPTPVGIFAPRDVYYPQTEELAPDESGRADMGDIIQQIYDRANEMYGTDLKPGF